MSKEKGSSLITILVFGTVSILVVSALINFSAQNLLAVRSAIASEQAFRAAEAGIEYYRFFLDRGGSVTSSTVIQNFGTSTSYEIQVVPTASGAKVTASGQSGSALRKIQADFIKGEGVSFHYGVQSGNGGFILGNGAEIIGNVYSNQDISGGNGSSISGDASAVGSITNVSVGGTKRTGVSVQALPISDAEVSDWKSDAAVSVFVGTKTLSGSNNSLGPIKIQGNLTLNGNASLVVENTIWVTGNLTLGNGSAISLSPNYSGQGGIIIVDGTVNLGNNAILNGSGTSGSYLMIISLSNSSAAITLGNNNGAVVLFAPNGTLNLGNNSNIKVLAAKTVSLGNNVLLEYEQGLIDLSFTSGPSGGWQMGSWKEVR